ncbi:MAG: alanine racemase, partial [Gammaproteobacteria bacterium]|nr:alanine racemase [Gammaproteobacteria bacterium]
AHPSVERVVLISHFANADQTDHTLNQQQQHCFERCCSGGGAAEVPRSLANSAALLGIKSSHYQWVRPGIMLYGGSPFTARSAASLNLRPAMTLQAPLIAVKQLKAGERVGYGSTWSPTRESRLGVVAIGYGHGYPRQLPTGTPLLLRGQRVPLVGRVSMDMVTVDITDIEAAAVGDPVTLWGEGLPADEIAQQAGTLCYELFCQLSSRVEREMR